jgi:Tfp pilus assembly protein PilN
VRPINLIPEQERRRQGGAGRTGPLAFIVIGALVIALGGVVALVTTSNQISERESELASLKSRTAAAQARADRLAPFTSFDEVKEQRTETISELADNRFDWSRVLHELSLVMPRWVILREVSGSSGKSEGESGGGGSTIGQSIEGPSLSVIGCAKSQARVAQMVAALKQIDGVTRVGLGSSVKELTQGGEGSGGGSNCNPGAFGFDAVAAFDSAPLPVEATEASAEPEATSESESSESTESGEGETANASSGAEETTTTGSDGSTTKVKTESVPPKS